MTWQPWRRHYRGVNYLHHGFYTTVLILVSISLPPQCIRSLRSSSKNLLQVINYNLKRYGYRAFSVCAPLIWNSLPINVRHSPSLEVFKKELKTHLFRLAY